jgi:hypothetical protein
MLSCKVSSLVLVALARCAFVTESFQGKLFVSNPAATAAAAALVSRKRTFASLVQVASTEKYSSQDKQQKKSLLTVIDDVGLSLKPKAIKTGAQVAMEEHKSKKVWLLAQTCLLYALFILYRAYRGFFVIIPAVFRDVYRKLEVAIDTPFDEAKKSVDESESSSPSNVLFRTRFTVAAVSGLVTVSYVLSGAFRVMSKLLRTVWETSDIASSFAAAADEQEINEDRVKLVSKRMKLNGDASSNGWDDEDKKKRKLGPFGRAS